MPAEPPVELDLNELKNKIGLAETSLEKFIGQAFEAKQINEKQEDKLLRKVNNAFDKLQNDLLQICKPKRN